MKKYIKKSTVVCIMSVTLVSALGAFSKNKNSSKSTQVENAKENNTKDAISVPENVQSMLEPADAILMCMFKNNLSYKPEVPTFF